MYVRIYGSFWRPLYSNPRQGALYTTMAKLLEAKALLLTPLSANNLVSDTNLSVLLITPRSLSNLVELGLQ
jgi:hypothetical protein